MKKLMVIPLVAAGMAAMVGCSKTPVREAAQNEDIAQDTPGQAAS